MDHKEVLKSCPLFKEVGDDILERFLGVAQRRSYSAGDLIFAELCLKKKVRLEIRIPFHEPEFLKKSVNFAGHQWQNRFHRVKQNANTKILIMPDELGPLPEDANPYEKNNLWQLQTALSGDAKNVNFLCLWDGKPGDGPGGTEHMHREVKKHSGKVHVIESIKLLKEIN